MSIRTAERGGMAASASVFSRDFAATGRFATTTRLSEKQARPLVHIPQPSKLVNIDARPNHPFVVFEKSKKRERMVPQKSGFRDWSQKMDTQYPIEQSKIMPSQLLRHESPSMKRAPIIVFEAKKATQPQINRFENTDVMRVSGTIVREKVKNRKVMTTVHKSAPIHVDVKRITSDSKTRFEAHMTKPVIEHTSRLNPPTIVATAKEGKHIQTETPVITAAQQRVVSPVVETILRSETLPNPVVTELRHITPTFNNNEKSHVFITQHTDKIAQLYHKPESIVLPRRQREEVKQVSTIDFISPEPRQAMTDTPADIDQDVKQMKAKLVISPMFEEEVMADIRITISVQKKLRILGYPEDRIRDMTLLPLHIKWQKRGMVLLVNDEKKEQVVPNGFQKQTPEELEEIFAEYRKLMQAQEKKDKEKQKEVEKVDAQKKKKKKKPRNLLIEWDKETDEYRRDLIIKAIKAAYEQKTYDAVDQDAQLVQATAVIANTPQQQHDDETVKSKAVPQIVENPKTVDDYTWYDDLDALKAAVTFRSEDEAIAIAEKIIKDNPAVRLTDNIITMPLGFDKLRKVFRQRKISLDDEDIQPAIAA